MQDMIPENAAAPNTFPGISLSEHGRWKQRNAEGLALAARGDWEGAKAAFDDALTYVDALTANDSVTVAAKDNSRAKVLLNLAQARFQAGDLVQAREFAERSLAIRVGLFGEDALVVARTRSDLATILIASGERDEASSLLDRAISAVEAKPGDQAALLIPVLSGAVRALDATIIGDAPPNSFQLRLDTLTQQLADARNRQENALPEHSFRDNAFASASDDHSLRAAIAETASLLRNTPTANIAHNVNLDDAVFDLVEPPPPTLSVLPGSPGKAATANPLGFEVQYGIPTQLNEPLDSADTMEIPIDTAPRRFEDAPLSSVPSHSGVSMDDSRQLINDRDATDLRRGIQRAPVRAIGGVRRGSTRVMTPKLVWYFVFALIAFSAGIAITMYGLTLTR